jgi:hypothetical protein
MISSRKHIDISKSHEIIFKPSVKIFPKKENIDHIIKRGMKKIEPHYSEPNLYTRKVLSHNITIKEDGVHCTKQFPEKAIECHDEYQIEERIKRKKRHPSLQAMRNGMPIISPGDKIYRNVEYSPDFFKLEGIVVGSTNTINHKKTSAKKGDKFFDSLNLNIKVLDKEKLWSTKCLKESYEFDNNYVGNLKTWEEVYLNPLLPEIKEEAKSHQPSKTINNAKKK